MTHYRIKTIFRSSILPRTGEQLDSIHDTLDEATAAAKRMVGEVGGAVAEARIVEVNIETGRQTLTREVCRFKRKADAS